ncbi:HesA/MoeB/ThiF family protein [Sphingoaurantiacus capsulatus]|uniref:HesA/MoeB/ThiF family protein n=1 Tax=Sphingoaurantiacus capsulatus TaxID=1771310 RepID=A0ABV7XDI8_9SPHN
MSLSDAQLDRYARHIILKEIGGAGQKALLDARVLVIGAGGLGSPCIQYLAAAGVGTIGVVDDDDVSLSNLQRQVLHGTEDVGRPKVESAAEAVARINPDVRIEPHAHRLTAENAAELVAAYDIVADGSDSFATRIAVADAAHRARKPLVSAAVGPFEGQLSVFRGWDGPCYRCWVGEAADGPEGTCAEQGVLGALTGVMGALQALEVIRAITGFGEGLAGRMLLFDALSMRTRTVTLPKDPACKGCSHG